MFSLRVGSSTGFLLLRRIAGSPSASAGLSSCFSRRLYSTDIPTHARVIRYHRNGQPQEVLVEETEPLREVKSTDVLIKMLAAPINPSDINMIQGNYGVAPTLPAIGGNEGVGVVTKVGSSVKNLKQGDWVIPARPGFGTWRNFAVAEESEVQKISNDIKPEYAATLAVNPCTALRLLDDFVTLNKGDVIIQNGANSTVGLAVMQMANSRGIKTINIIRNRDDFEATVEKMKAYGGYMVVTEDYIRTPEFARLISDLPKPKLALNCVGGQVATDMARTLGYGGTMVTYGGMSKKPVTIPTSLLIFKDIKLKGFWLSKWIEQHSTDDRKKMFDTLIPLVKSGTLRFWMERFKFEDFKIALKAYEEPKKSRKVILTMQH